MSNLDIQTISQVGNVTEAYARMLLNGTRRPSLALALKLYDKTGSKLGPLSSLSDREIEMARKMAA